MAGLNDGFKILYLGVAAAVYFKPDYTINNSRTITLAIFFAIITVSKLIYQLFLYPRFFTPLKQLPTPSERHWFKGNSTSGLIDTPHEQIHEWATTIPNDGLLRFYIVGQLERVVLTNPKALSEVLNSKVYDFAKPNIVQQNLRRVVGDGVLLAEGDDHKFQRKNLLPAFSYRHIKDLYPIFWEKSTEMAKLIRRDVETKGPNEDNTITVRTYASRATLDIIGLAGMGHDFDSLQNPENRLYKSYQKIFTSPSTFTRVLFLVGVMLGDMKIIHKIPTARNKTFAEGRFVIRETARQMLREKEADVEDEKKNTGIDIISVAMRSGNFEEENLLDQLMTFLAAGHETTASALQWAVYALCKNPEVQERLREEVRTHLPPINVEDPEPIDAAAIDNLAYLNAVCNEVLRFYPSVPNTVREATKDTSVVGQPIPKGTILILSPELLNHLPELWGPDADKFNPDRWMGPGKANTGGATSNYAFLSFLHGPRACIGQGFSKAELACLIAVLVGSFKFELKYPDAKLELKMGATSSPKDGVQAKFTPLDGW
ncbi:CTP synthase [Penicillium odoratum]|uniref:CTP synthase n=1 Tax=Penicillium odoratum TaxID=1167516 RepID=UPI00254911C4|nr:CTP synthase [Penicillium odoratum]KAJ5759400.1 CTP synthase [Penicillium odoratum]